MVFEESGFAAVSAEFPFAVASLGVILQVEVSFSSLLEVVRHFDAEGDDDHGWFGDVRVYFEDLPFVFGLVMDLLVSSLEREQRLQRRIFEWLFVGVFRAF